MNTYVQQFHNRAGTIAHSPRYVHITRVYTHNQKGSSTHLLLGHPHLNLNITRYSYDYLCAVGFERIFTCDCESFFFVLRVFYILAFFYPKVTYPPQKGNLVI